MDSGQILRPRCRYFAIHDRPVARSATRASPNTMRYQANRLNERCDTKRMSHRTTTSALANATTKPIALVVVRWLIRSEEHTSELQSLAYLVCRLLLEKKKYTQKHVLD